MRLTKVAACAASLALIAPLAMTQAMAQEAAADQRLIFQLNNAQTVESGCQLTSVIKNDTGTEIKKSSYNMAIVNAEGQVATLVTFEFRPLPVGRTKVQQFGLAGQPCETISAISINEFVDCLDNADQPLTVCESAIVQSTKTSIQFPWEL
jgi:hypothetical protein